MQSGPTAPIQVQSASSMSLIGPGPIGAATTTAQFAHFAVGGGYTTIFTFLNTGGTALTGTLFLTGQDGNPFTAKLSSGSTQTTGTNIPLSVESGGVEFVTAAPLSASDPTKAGWARVESSGGTIGGVGTFELTSGSTLTTIAGVLSSSPVTTATIPVDDDVAANRYTGYAIANPSATDTITIKVQTVGANGTPGTTLSPITLAPGKQTASFLFQDPASSRKFQGSVVLIEQGGKSFVVVALVQNHGLFTAIPVIPAKAPNIN
jgi:hypothetical protein